MWSFIAFLIISFYISGVFGVDKFRQLCAENSENEKKKHDYGFLLDLTDAIKADRYFSEHSTEIINEVSDDLEYIYGDLSDVKFITYLSDYKEVWSPSMVAFHIWLAKKGYVTTREYSLKFLFKNKEEELKAKRTFEVIERNIKKHRCSYELLYVPSPDYNGGEREYCYGRMTWNYALPEYNRKAPVKIRKWWRYSWC